MLHLSGKIRKFYKSYQLLLFGNSRSIKTIELEGQVSEIFSAPFENVFDRSLDKEEYLTILMEKFNSLQGEKRQNGMVAN